MPLELAEALTTFVKLLNIAVIMLIMMAVGGFMLRTLASFTYSRSMKEFIKNMPRAFPKEGPRNEEKQ